MNKIYKVIWSKVRNCYVAVSEIAKRNGKNCTSVNCGAKATRGHAGVALAIALSLSMAGGGVAQAAEIQINRQNPDPVTSDESTYDYHELRFSSGSEAGTGVYFTVGNGGKVKVITSYTSGNTIKIEEGGEVLSTGTAIKGGINNNSVTVEGTVKGVVNGGNIENSSSYSGLMDNDVTNNTVTVKGNALITGGQLIGGHSYNGDATSNSVEISGSATIGKSGSTKKIYGGYAVNGAATGNTVDINLVTNDNGTPNNTADDTGVIWGTVYGGYSASGKVGGSNEEDGNTVTISGGKVSGDVYGGYGNSSGYNSPVIYNTVKIESGTVTGNVYGGYAISSKAGEYLDGNYNGNYVTISGGTVGGFVIGGYSQNRAVGNEVTISGETNNKSIITGNIVGGSVGGSNPYSAENNTVTINDNSEVSGSIYGGIGNSGGVTNNRVYINGGTINSSLIVGGDSWTYSTKNAVIIKGGTFDSNQLMIYGGKSSSNVGAGFDNNFVTLAGGSFASGSFNTESDYLRIIGGYNDGSGTSSTTASNNTVNLYGSVTGLEKAELWGFYPKNKKGSSNQLYIGGTKDDSKMLASGTIASPWTGTTGNKVKSVNNFSTIFLKNVNWDTATPVLAAGTFTNKNNDSKLDISGIVFNEETPLTLGTMVLLKSYTQDDALSSINLNYIDKDDVTQYNQPIGDDGIKLKSISDFGTDTSITGVSVAYDGARKVTRDSDDTSTSINYTIYPEYKSATLGGTTLGAMNWGEGYTFASGAAINSGGLAVTIDGNFAVTDAENQENNQSFNLLDLSATSGTIAGSPSKSVTVSKTNQAVTTDNKLTFSWNRTDTVVKNSDGNKLVYTTGATIKVTTATFNGEIAWNTGTPYYNAAGSVYTFDGDTAINATNLTFTGTTDTNPMGQSTVLLANATNISGDHITQPGTGIGTVTVSGYTENGMTYDATAKGTVTVVSTDTSKNVNYTINNVVASKVTLGSLDWGKTDTALPTGWTASGTMTVDDTNFGYSGTASTALKAGNTSTILTASGLTETGSVTLGTNKTVGMNYTDSSSGINFVGTVNGHVAAAENAVNYVVDSVTLSSVDLAGWTGTGYTMAAGDAWNANGSGVTVATENITNLPTLSAGASQPILTTTTANYFSDDKISATNKYQAYSYTPSVVNGVTFGGSQSKGVKTAESGKNLVYAVGKMDVSTVSFDTMAWGTGRAASTADDFTSLTGSNINASNLSFTFTATDKEGLSKTSSMTLLSDAVNLTAGLTITGASRTQAIDYAASNGAALSGTLTGTVVTESSAGVGTIKFNASSMTLDSVNLAGWNGTSASTVPAGWDKNAAGVTVATENMTNLPTLSAGATQAILTTTTANYFSDDKISATNKYQAYSYTPSVVNGVTFGGSQSKGVKTNDDKSGLVYAVGKMDVSTVSFGTMAWGTGRAASTADDFAGITTIDASNLSFTFSDTDKEGLSKTSSTTLLSGAANLAAGKTVTYKNSGTNYTQTIDYAAGNGAALSGTLTGTVSTTAGAASFNANSMTLDSVNLAGWNGTSASTVPTGWDKNAAGVTVATENMTNLPTLSAGATQAILTTTTANYFSDDKISATNKYQAYSYTPSVVNGVTFGGSQSKGVKTADSGKNLVYAVGKMDVSTVSFGTMTWGTGRAASTADDFAGVTTVDASNLTFTFSGTDKEGLSKTSSTTLLSGAANLAAGKTVTYKNSGTNYTQTINYAAGNGAALSGTLTGTVSTTEGAASFNANSMTLDTVTLAGWDGTATSAVPAGWDKNSAGVTVNTNSMTNLPELAAGASRDILTASSGFFTFEKIEGTNKYGNGDSFSVNLNGITVAGHELGGIKDTDSGAKLTFFGEKKNVEDITLGEMAFANGGKGATLTGDYDATGATITNNLKFTEASRALMNSGSSMTIVDASAAIKNAGGNALPSFTAKNYDSTFTDSVTDQLTLTGTRRDTLTQDAAQTKLTYTVGDRVVSKAAMSGEIAWQSGDTHYANTAYTFNSSTAVDIANVKFTATDDPLNTSMTLIGNAAGVTAGNVSGSPGFTVALKNTTITATATGNASMDAGDLKYTVTGVTLDSVSVNGVGSDAIPAGWGTVANVKIDTDNMTVPADATYGSPQVIMTASSAIFTDDNITGTKKFGANPVRFTDEDNTDAVVIVGKQNAGVKASADGKSLLYEVGKKEASSVTLAKVDWAKGATVFDGSSEEYDYSGIQSLGTDSFDVAYSAPEMVAAGDNMTLLQANATLKDMAAETRSASYSFAPVSGVTVDAAVTGSLEAKGGNVTYTATANQASKLTFTNVDWKDSGALMTRPSNITFAGADVDTAKIHFKNVKELDANRKMTLVSDFGDSVGTINGTKYTVGAGLEGEGAASLSGSDLIFTTKTGARDLAALAQTHNTLMVMEAGMAVLAAGREHLGQAMVGLADPQNAGSDGTRIGASMGGGWSRYKTGSHVDSNNWNVAVAVGSKRELKKGSLEWGVFGEYGKSNYTLHSDAGRGDGDSHYAGGGLMAKWTNKHDVYTEASVRLGRLNDTASNLLRDAAGNGYGYDVHANYFGAHVGIGKIIRYKGGKSLDVYGKYFYTKRDGVDFASGGNNYSLDSVASSILRVGARYGTTDKKWNWYGGLAYEYEFDGKSEGTVDGIGIRAASVKGGSVRGEIGLRMSATKTNPWQTDISIYGYGGKHRGFGGSVNVAYMF